MSRITPTDDGRFRQETPLSPEGKEACVPYDTEGMWIFTFAYFANRENNGQSGHPQRKEQAMPYIDCPLHDPKERVESQSNLSFCLAVIDHMVGHCRTPMSKLPPDVLADLDAKVEVRTGRGGNP